MKNRISLPATVIAAVNANPAVAQAFQELDIVIVDESFARTQQLMIDQLLKDFLEPTVSAQIYKKCRQDYERGRRNYKKGKQKRW
jgi:hypothetical protein